MLKTLVTNKFELVVGRFKLMLAIFIVGFSFSLILQPAYVNAASPPAAPDERVDPALAPCSSDSCDFIGKYVNPGIRLLSITFGIVAVISLILGGIQYSASAGDPQAVSKAKKRITDTIIAIVAYFFLLGFLEFLIPGKIINII